MPRKEEIHLYGALWARYNKNISSRVARRRPSWCWKSHLEWHKVKLWNYWVLRYPTKVPISIYQLVLSRMAVIWPKSQWYGFVQALCQTILSLNESSRSMKQSFGSFHEILLWWIAIQLFILNPHQKICCQTTPRWWWWFQKHFLEFSPWKSGEDETILTFTYFSDGLVQRFSARHVCLVVPPLGDV